MEHEKIRELLTIHLKLALAISDIDTEVSILEYKADEIIKARLEDKLKNIESLISELKEKIK